MPAEKRKCHECKNKGREGCLSRHRQFKFRRPADAMTGRQRVVEFLHMQIDGELPFDLMLLRALELTNHPLRHTVASQVDSVLHKECSIAAS